MTMPTRSGSPSAPGALRWSASVNPQGGTVADQEMEPVGVGIDLTKEQRDCVATVLSKPVYKLTAPGRSVPVKHCARRGLRAAT